MNGAVAIERVARPALAGAAARVPLHVAVLGNAIARRGDTWYTHHSFGRIVELLAERVASVHCHGPQAAAKTADMCDYPLDAPNIAIHPWREQVSSFQLLRRPLRLLRDYWRMASRGDAVFLRGTWPLCWTVHWFAGFQGKPVVHWIAGNPLSILRGGGDRGYRGVIQTLGVAYAWSEQFMTRLGRTVSDAVILANGAEMAEVYASPRTEAVVSTSITRADFLVRNDTCHADRIRILFVGFVRPEKGIEYLLRAIPRLRASRPVELAIVGTWAQFGGYHERLTALIDELRIGRIVSWEGYAEFGPRLFAQMDRSDLLVLPTLSEGTPRVLVEARARSVPIVSTDVGGIPSSVTHERDGLLVPPRDSDALAAAIDRLIEDGALRRRLIAEGRRRVETWTIDRFVDRIVDRLMQKDIGSAARGTS
jgi:glycosyltransferase involved in cell wall biosynthesis